MNTPRAQSPLPSSRPKLERRATSQPPPVTKSVRFNSDPVAPPAPCPPPPHTKPGERGGASKHNASHHDDGYDSEDDQSRARERRRRDRARNNESGTSSPSESDSTVDLPPRFDERGRPLPEREEDDFVHKFEELLSGRGSLGDVLHSFGLGGGDDDDSERDEHGDGDRRRRRRRH